MYVDVLRKQMMQEKLSQQEFRIVPVPGTTPNDFAKMTREQLKAELKSLRESEVGAAGCT